MANRDLKGQKIGNGKYEIGERIGEGGMGAVYLAQQLDKKIDVTRQVAIKVFFFNRENPKLEERFSNEIEIVANLIHPHIVTLHDFSTEDDFAYMVMPHLKSSLGEWLEYRKAEDFLPSPQEVADLLDQLADALDYAHQQQVIHRDIKPSNIMFDNQNRPYIVDFGIAKLKAGREKLDLTQGQAPGTPSFMAPEQWNSGEVVAATDQYALAGMVYYLLTGYYPFEAETWEGLVKKHLYEMPTPIHFQRPNLPAALTPVIEKGLAKYPEQRYATVTEFAQAFRAAMNAPAIQSSVPPIGVTPRSQRTNRPPKAWYQTSWGWIGLAVLALVAGIIGGVVLFGGGDDDNPSPTDTPQVLAETEMPAQVELSPSPEPSSTTAPAPTVDIASTHAQATAALETRVAQLVETSQPSITPLVVNTPVSSGDVTVPEVDGVYITRSPDWLVIRFAGNLDDLKLTTTQGTRNFVNDFRLDGAGELKLAGRCFAYRLASTQASSPDTTCPSPEEVIELDGSQVFWQAAVAIDISGIFKGICADSVTVCAYNR